MMKIIVCIKQVPDTTVVKIDPVKGTLIREGVPSIMNPDDKGALELALRMKDQYGAHVTVISMGPPQADVMLREAFAMGFPAVHEEHVAQTDHEGAAREGEDKGAGKDKEELALVVVRDAGWQGAGRGVRIRLRGLAPNQAADQDVQHVRDFAVGRIPIRHAATYVTEFRDKP